MADPFKAVGREERLAAVIWSLGLLALVAAISFALVRWRNDQGTLIEGQVVSFGSPYNKYGGLVVEVRLADGAVRKVPTGWGRVKGCARGDRIAIVQRGTALHVGMIGCNIQA